MEESLRLIKDLDLAPHPEGGWFRRTAESDVYVPSIRCGERYIRALGYCESQVVMQASLGGSCLLSITYWRQLLCRQTK